MTPVRWAVAIAAVALLGVLLAWQIARERQMAACEASRGIWDGPRSRCRPARAIIIQRDLHRS